MTLPLEVFQQIRRMVGPTGFECYDCKRILPEERLTGLQSRVSITNHATTSIILRCQDCVEGKPVVRAKPGGVRGVIRQWLGC